MRPVWPLCTQCIFGAKRDQGKSRARGIRGKFIVFLKPRAIMVMVVMAAMSHAWCKVGAKSYHQQDQHSCYKPRAKMKLRAVGGKVSAAILCLRFHQSQESAKILAHLLWAGSSLVGTPHPQIILNGVLFFILKKLLKRRFKQHSILFIHVVCTGTPWQ